MQKFNIDYERVGRIGFPEAVYGESKSLESLSEILNELTDRKQNGLVTKLQNEKGAALAKLFPKSFFDETSGVFILEFAQSKLVNSNVAIVAAGTSDIGIVNEAFYTLAYLGLRAKRILDVGVAGIHRFLDRVEELSSYDVVIVVAGFEGALASVAGGLLPQPIVAVPTSVGYGVSKNGETALQAMLASCANGIAVVNIDNGYGAALAAYRILKRMEKNDQSEVPCSLPSAN